VTIAVDTGAVPRPATADSRLGLLALGGCASLGAGAVHAAAIGAHSEHRAAVVTFSALALLQLGWGALVLARTRRSFALAGAVINLGAVAGWALAKSSGIGFIAGLEAVEPIQLADGIAAGLAAVAALAALRWLGSSYRGRTSGLTSTRLSTVALVTVALASTGMVAAGGHRHVHDAAGHEHTAAVAPHPYDPELPIDLSGVAGVTPQQQARAENLIAVTLARLPRFTDPAFAEANGFHSIHDGQTGFEHYINTDYMRDADILDPDHPESLVYDVSGGHKRLVSAMFMLPPGSTLDDVPDLGGPLTQWHVHDNLCFFPDSGTVAGLTDPDGTCPAPLEKAAAVPMIHVWITSHPCGPFASLEGVAAGSIKAGETRLCDHVHGAA
jgi:hypothetical protein